MKYKYVNLFFAFWGFALILYWLFPLSSQFFLKTSLVHSMPCSFRRKYEEREVKLIITIHCTLGIQDLTNFSFFQFCRLLWQSFFLYVVHRHHFIVAHKNNPVPLDAGWGTYLKCIFYSASTAFVLVTQWNIMTETNERVLPAC